MTEREFVPLAVEVRVSHFERSLSFYQNILEFTPIRIEPELKFASFDFHGAVFMIQEGLEPNLRTSATITRFIIPNAKAYYEALGGRSVTITKPLKETSYGLARFYIQDPDGYQLKFASRP